MHERLAQEKRKADLTHTEGNMPAIVVKYIEQHARNYAESYRAEWKRRGEDVRAAFRAFDIAQVNTAAVMDFLENNWANKATMKRAMKAWLTSFFDWAILRGHLIVNPCSALKVKKPLGRTAYITNEHFALIRAALASYTYEKKLPSGEVQTVVAKVPTGPEMQVFVDLCYLTCQRSTEIRQLRWSQIDERAKVIRFKPSKTAKSTGQAVDIPITPAIAGVLQRARTLRGDVDAPRTKDDFVVVDSNGKSKTDAACRDAWRRALVRAKLEEEDYVVKDIRAKALTDAEAAGYKMDALQVVGAHANLATTAKYIKQRKVPVSVVRLQLPAGEY
ncbi:Protein Gp33 [Cupriavidus taiwanensis]|uniref:tyrosine-type recombinase/integrase n=1 Tax=Cupriavidus taiwanensis TaxID=164546 RepID=UPI000E17E00B|nr:tyrosine-type recombinase/integrase [Cupriavidus taiwanensis]SPA40184.1 Protein Gp33 [Cupriavidus taiwanensis]